MRSFYILTSLILQFLTTGCLATSGPPISPSASGRALVVMDMQVDFLADEAPMPISRAQVPEVIETTNRAARAFEAEGEPVFYVSNVFLASDTVGNWIRNDAAIKGSKGAELDPRVVRVEASIFDKDMPDAFSNPAFDAALRDRGVGHLIIAGVFADQCVYWTIRGALNRGYRVTVIDGGLGAASSDDLKAALDDLRGLGVQVVSIESLSADVFAHVR